MQQKEEYNETELGLLPNEWAISKIGDLYNVKQGKQLSARESKEGKIKKPFLRTSNLTNGRITVSKIDHMYFTSDEFEKLKLQQRDILVCEGGDIGRTALYGGELEECAYQNHIHRLRPKTEKTDNLFFVYWMNHAINQRKIYLHDANRTTIPNLSGSRLKNFEMVCPPLPEQQNIASVLSSVQESKEKTDAVVFALRETKRSLMKHLFTYGPVPIEEAENIELKETEIGKMPKEWGLEEINKLIKKTKQKDMRKEQVEFRYVDVSSIDRESLRISGHTLHKGKSSPSRARKIVNKNDVIVATVRPTLRRLALIPEEYDKQICSTAFCVLRVTEQKLNSKYLFYSIQRPIFFDVLSAIQRGASYPAVTDSDIKRQKISLPTLSVQKEIADALFTIDARIESEQNKANALNELFNSMLRDLMTAKVRVNNLVVTNG